MKGINGINRVSLNTEPLTQKIERRNSDFAQRIKSAVNDVNERQHIADDAIEKVIQGEMGVHEGMLALSKASISLKILAQVRNKVMNAYETVMRMQV